MFGNGTENLEPTTIFKDWVGYTRFGYGYGLEFCGAFVLIFSGCTAVALKSPLIAVAFAHGIALLCGIESFGPISGGHFNPCVTFALTLFNRCPILLAPLYIIAQLFGGVVAAAVVYAIDIKSKNAVGKTMLSTDCSVGCGIIVEAFITFVLVIIILTITNKKVQATRMDSVGIGLVLAGMICTAGPITGASMNPARSFGPALISMDFKNQYIYWVGPFLGATIASIISFLLYDGSLGIRRHQDAADIVKTTSSV